MDRAACEVTMPPPPTGTSTARAPSGRHSPRPRVGARPGGGHTLVTHRRCAAAHVSFATLFTYANRTFPPPTPHPPHTPSITTAATEPPTHSSTTDPTPLLPRPPGHAGVY